jgi:hypothetical protein
MGIRKRLTVPGFCVTLSKNMEGVGRCFIFLADKTEYAAVLLDGIAAPVAGKW